MRQTDALSDSTAAYRCGPWPAVLVGVLTAFLAACDVPESSADGSPSNGPGEDARTGQTPPAGTSAAGTVTGGASAAVAPLPEARRERLCAEIANRYECSQRVERELLEHGAGSIKRTGDTLAIELTAGGVRTLVDRGEQAEAVYHTYDGYLAAIGYHRVQVHYYEGGTHLLIDAATGQETRVPGPPAVSPDGRRVAIASFGGVAGYAPNLLQIRRVTTGGLPVEWELEPDDWGADSPRWTDASTVRFTRLWICDSGTCEEEAEARYVDGEWSLRGAP